LIIDVISNGERNLAYFTHCRISPFGRDDKSSGYTTPGGVQTMQGILARWLILTAAILVTSYVMQGIEVENFFSAFLAAAVLGILNVFFRPILLILTLPINILSLGLFTFVINALLLMMASGVISGFVVRGFWSAVFGSLLISVVSWVLNSLLNRRKKEEEREKDGFIDLERKKGDRWE
jgi:putative membrane protein